MMCKICEKFKFFSYILLMKKFKRQIILFLCLAVFIALFKYSVICKASILGSIEVWVFNLVTSMLPIYIITDLLINYGILNIFYKMFKTNAIFLVFISLIAGTPSNAKYIKEFYNNGFITLDMANFLLLFSYSPNPLFVLGIAQNLKMGLSILAYIYFTNILIFLFFKKKFKTNVGSIEKIVLEKPFSQVLEESIFKSVHILILILGVVIVYGIINTLLKELGVESLFISSLLEMTNAVVIINNNGGNILWLIFACTFAGLSIHTQIKSILEDTEISYKYFILGRVLACIPILIAIIFRIY